MSISNFMASIEAEPAKSEADARALWAVRVLDAWIVSVDGRNWRVTHRVLQLATEHLSELHEYECMAPGRALGSAGSPDAARLDAAEAVFPTLPADVRAKLGERP